MSKTDVICDLPRLRNTIIKKVNAEVDEYFRTHTDYNITDVNVEITFHKEEKIQAHAHKKKHKIKEMKK